MNDSEIPVAELSVEDASVSIRYSVSEDIDYFWGEDT